MAILSGGSPRELMRAIAAGDAKRFQAVPGIGKRTAERVIVELREKVAGELEEGVALGAAADGEEDPRLLAREGLMHLGYTLTEAERLLAGAEGGSAEELISAAQRQAVCVRPRLGTPDVLGRHDGAEQPREPGPLQRASDLGPRGP